MSVAYGEHVEAPVAAIATAHITPAPAMPDVLPPVRPRGRVRTFIHRYPTMAIGGTLLFIVLFVAVDRNPCSRPSIPRHSPRPAAPARPRRNTGSAPTCWAATSIPACSTAPASR